MIPLRPQSLLDIAITRDSAPEFEVKNLLLKTIHTGVVEHGRNKVLVKVLPYYWLGFTEVGKEVKNYLEISALLAATVSWDDSLPWAPERGLRGNALADSMAKRSAKEQLGRLKVLGSPWSSPSCLSRICWNILNLPVKRKNGLSNKGLAKQRIVGFPPNGYAIPPKSLGISPFLNSPNHPFWINQTNGTDER